MAPSSVVESPSVEIGQEASNDNEPTLDGALGMPDAEFANPEWDSFDWMVPDIDFANFLSLQTGDKSVQHPSSRSSSFVHQSTLWIDQTVQGQQASPYLDISISPVVSTQSVRSLIPRQEKKNRTHGITILILSTLKSYPRMMRHDTLPPFIHPRLLSSGVEDNHMEPIHNCISLVHMTSSGVPGNRKLFWKNVRLECERLYAEVCCVYFNSKGTPSCSNR